VIVVYCIFYVRISENNFEGHFRGCLTQQPYDKERSKAEEPVAQYPPNSWLGRKGAKIGEGKSLR
jgi:hypothetical protein